MSRLSVKPKRISHPIPPVSGDLRFDDARRLRNALRALSQLDPGFLWWIERTIPQGLPRFYIVRQVERRARLLVMRHYGGIIPRGQKISIIYSDMFFNDDGNLQAYE